MEFWNGAQREGGSDHLRPKQGRCLRLAGAYFPTLSSSRARGPDVGGLVESVAPCQDLKIFKAYTSVDSKSLTMREKSRSATRPLLSWDKVKRRLARHIPTFDAQKRKSRTIACHQFIRGAAPAATTIRELEMAPWALPVTTTASKSPALPGGVAGRSMTVCANRTDAAADLRSIHRKAAGMYEAGAYVHWYTRHGCEVGDFVESFNTCAHIVKAYEGCF